MTRSKRSHVTLKVLGRLRQDSVDRGHWAPPPKRRGFPARVPDLLRTGQEDVAPGRNLQTLCGYTSLKPFWAIAND